MVVHKLLACTQPNRHETSTALWNPYHRVSAWGQRAQIHFRQGVCDENPENNRPPFWFYGENIRLLFSTTPQQHNTSLAEGGLPLLVYYISNFNTTYIYIYKILSIFDRMGIYNIPWLMPFITINFCKTVWL